MVYVLKVNKGRKRIGHTYKTKSKAESIKKRYDELYDDMYAQYPKEAKKLIGKKPKFRVEEK